MQLESCRDERTARREELFGALASLRDAPAAPDRSGAWKIVQRHVHRALPPECEDERQSALLAVLESAATLRATSAVGAAAWVRAVCRNQRIDAHRARHVGRDTPFDDGHAHASTASADPPAELSDRVIDAFIARVDQYLAYSALRPSTRARRRTQAIVAVRRLALEDSLPEIAEGLALTISVELLTKWVERGRAVILATIEYDRGRDPDVADLFAPFADLALARRVDAGRPRPDRRRPST